MEGREEKKIEGKVKEKLIRRRKGKKIMKELRMDR